MSKRDHRLCHTSYCRNNHALHSSHCHKCKKRIYRAKNKVRAAYQNLRDSAAKRDIFIDLTFEEFEEVCHETDYIAKKGRSSTSYSVDRKIEGKFPGYTKSNIQVVTVAYNTTKENKRRVKKYLEYDYRTRTAFVVSVGTQTQEFLF